MLSSIKKILSAVGLDKAGKKIVSKLNFNLKRNYFGKNFIIPIVNNLGYDNLVLYDGVWKKNFFEKLLKLKEGIFIDIGVNIGQTLILLRAFDEKIQYIGFEPNAACIYYVNLLMRANKFKNSVVVPTGVYNSNNIMSFDITGDSDQGGTIVQNLRPGLNYLENIFVPVFDFDTLKKDLNIDKVSLIKIDVEGSELGVLQSLKNFLMKDKSLVVCEILWAHNEDKLKDNEKRNEEIMKLAKEMDYKVFQIIKKEDKSDIAHLKSITKIENKIYTLENREECDYLLIDESLEQGIKNIYKII